VDLHGSADGKPPKSGRDDAPTCRCPSAVARNGKGRVGDLPRGSLELGERPGDSGEVAAVVGLGGACSDVGEEERGVVSGAGCSEQRCPFIGAGGGHQAMIMVDIGGETSGGVNGDLSAVKLRFRGVMAMV
jgi:hypothetical protein